MNGPSPRPNADSADVLVADGDARVRRALRAMIEAERDMSVVGEATGLDEVLEWTQRLQPDVVLLDIGSAETEHGLALLRRLTHARRWVVVTSMRGHLRDAALSAGACAFVEKGAEPGALLDAIRSAAAAERGVGRRRPVHGPCRTRDP